MSKLVSPAPVGPKGGRPAKKNVKLIADGIFYRLRTGCQWDAVPRQFGPKSTLHDYFKRWSESGVFEKLWEIALEEYDELKGIDWRHQSLDTASVKSPLGGEKNRKKSDRPRQIRIEAFSVRRRARYPNGLGYSGSEHA